MAELKVEDKNCWEFQENVLVTELTAITRHTEVWEWVILMISERSFSENVKLEAEVFIRDNGQGIGFLPLSAAIGFAGLLAACGGGGLGGAGSNAAPVAAETVTAPRVLECPVQLEAKVEAVHGVAEDDPRQKGAISLIEVRIVRVHLEEQILMAGDRNRVDPDKWRPLIMSFQEFYGLAPSKVRPSTLAEIPERLYRAPDVDRARDEPMRLG